MPETSSSAGRTPDWTQNGLFGKGFVGLLDFLCAFDIMMIPSYMECGHSHRDGYDTMQYINLTDGPTDDKAILGEGLAHSRMLDFLCLIC